MSKIDLKSYTKDTLSNLVSFVEKLSKTKIDLLNYEKHFNIEYGNVNNKKVIFIGGPQISGSVSPFMHTYSSYINNNPYLYVLFDMVKENTEIVDIFNYIKENENILGANVTMPYKIEVFNLLNKLGCLDESAKLVGAVNTLTKVNGEIIGFNTDLFGILKPIKGKLGLDLNSIKKGYILGSGGAARAAIGALLKLGIKDIIIFSRSEDSLTKLLNHFDSEEVSLIIGYNYNISIIKYDQVDENNNSIANYIDTEGILINTLPVGFKSDSPKFPILENEFDDVFSNISLYFDIVYDINHNDTPMSRIVKEMYPEIINCDGIDMVVSQAKKGFEMWSKGDSFNEENIKQILRLK